MAFRSPVADAPPRSVRWDRDRFYYEQDRDRESRLTERRSDFDDRRSDFSDRRSDFSEVRERFADGDDHVYSIRGGRRGSVAGPPPGSVVRERSVDRFEQDRLRTRNGDDAVIRDREQQRRVVYDDESSSLSSPRSPRFARRPPPPLETDFERKVVIEKERDRVRSPSPLPALPRRPGTVMRRQSSLDTFDRRRYHDHDHDDFSTITGSSRPSLPPLRRGDEYRLPPYQPIPLPRHKALPPPRVYGSEREYERDFDEISVIDPHRYGDEEFHHHAFAPPPPMLPRERERIREREIIRTRRQSPSRGSRSRRRSRSSSTSSSSSSSTEAPTVRSEYPKKGKTRIPQRLVSKRALFDLDYPFEEEGTTIVVQKALGQDNIDDLLKLSQEYKKEELEVLIARSSVDGDRKTEILEKKTEIVQAALPPPAPEPIVEPVIIAANPPEPAEEVVETTTTTIVRDVSPARSRRSHRSSHRSRRHRSYSTSSSHHRPLIVEASPREREVSEEMQIGPLALVESSPRREVVSSKHYHRHHHHHHRRNGSLFGGSSHTHSHSRSRSRHHRHRSHSIDLDSELVRAERLPTGELVVFEERVEKIEEPRRGPRIEMDRKGRMSFVVPKR